MEQTRICKKHGLFFPPFFKVETISLPRPKKRLTRTINFRNFKWKHIKQSIKTWVFWVADYKCRIKFLIQLRFGSKKLNFKREVVKIDLKNRTEGQNRGILNHLLYEHRIRYFRFYPDLGPKS